MDEFDMDKVNALPDFKPDFNEVEVMIEDLYQFIAHGDEAHRAWLRAALMAYAMGEKRPPEMP